MTDPKSGEQPGGPLPAAGQQHGSSSGSGGTVGEVDVHPGGKPQHPRPDTPESKVEHQADQPVPSGGEEVGGQSDAG